VHSQASVGGGQLPVQNGPHEFPKNLILLLDLRGLSEWRAVI